MQRGSFQWMKSLNKSMILNKIRTSGSISRAQIAKETQLTPPTVGSIVKELIEQELIKESKLGVSQGGRKPTMLEVNTSGFHIIGIDVGPVDIRLIASDLAGDIRDELTITLPEKLDEEQFLHVLIHAIGDLQRRNQALRFIGIGVAMHGIVEARDGVSLFAPNLQLRNMPIKKRLEEAFSLDVRVENDAKALALGEAWFQDQVAHAA